MEQQPWQQQLNQFIASLPQLLGLALGMGAMTGMVGAVKGPPAPLLMAHTRTQVGLPPEPRPSREDLRVETWFERDRAFVGIKDVTTDRFIAEWWDDDVRHLKTASLRAEQGLKIASWTMPGIWGCWPPTCPTNSSLVP